MGKRSFQLLLLLVIPAPWSYAQVKAPEVRDVAPVSPRFPASWYPPDSDVGYTSRPSRGAPYTATLVTSWQAGDKPMRESTFQARDSAGRMRSELNLLRPDGHGGTITVHIVSVGDPVSHCSFRWTEPVVAPDTTSAIVDCNTRTLHYGPAMYAGLMTTAPKEEHTLPNIINRSQPLGHRLIEGLDCVGLRRTRIQTDPQTHIASSLSVEFWYAPELQEVLEMRSFQNEPAREGEASVTRLTHINREEPAGSLFYPPAGYKIAPGH
jgi:hypothetical protein